MSAVLSTTHEDLSLDPSIYTKAREVVCICNPSAGKAEPAGLPELAAQPVQSINDF